MNVSSFPKPASPALFASVRGSRDRSLVAFGAALLTAFALQAGAFLPRISSPGAGEASAAARAATPAPAAVVASQAGPCAPPRG